MTDKGNRKILVALDGSDASMDTVVYLANILPAANTELVLFSVMTEIPETFWDIDYSPSRVSQNVWIKYKKKFLEKFMEKACQVFRDFGFDNGAITIKIQDRSKGIARDIIDESAKGYDSLVFGRVGMNPITRLMIGSVANKLVDSIVDIPLCIAGKNINSRKIIIALDTSENAMKCVQYAGKMFAQSDVQFLLLHVIREYDFHFDEVREKDDVANRESRWDETTQEKLAKVENQISYIMNDARRELEKSGIASNQITAKILTGMATRGGSIAAQALMGGYSTVIIGRKGLSQVMEFNMGRVCYKIIQLANELAVWVVN